MMTYTNGRSASILRQEERMSDQKSSQQKLSGDLRRKYDKLPDSGKWRACSGGLQYISFVRSQPEKGP